MPRAARLALAAADGRWDGCRIVPFPFTARDPREEDEEVVVVLGFGVVLFSAEGRRLLRCGPGVFNELILGSGRDASDMGGEGGP